MLPQSDYHKFGSKYAMAGTESYPPTDSEQVLIKRQLACCATTICLHCAMKDETAKCLLLSCPAECQHQFGKYTDITDVFRNYTNLLEFLISSVYIDITDVFRTYTNLLEFHISSVYIDITDVSRNYTNLLEFLISSVYIDITDVFRNYTNLLEFLISSVYIDITDVFRNYTNILEFLISSVYIDITDVSRNYTNLLEFLISSVYLPPHIGIVCRSHYNNNNNNRIHLKTKSHKSISVTRQQVQWSRPQQKPGASKRLAQTVTKLLGGRCP